MGTVTYSANPPSPTPVMRSPTRKSLTCAPTSTTSPLSSCPMTRPLATGRPRAPNRRKCKVTRAGAERTLVGQLTAADDRPGGVVGVEVVTEHAGGPTVVESDQRGRFVAAGIAAGPVRLRCRPPRPAPEVVTDWVTL